MTRNRRIKIKRAAFNNNLKSCYYCSRNFISWRQISIDHFIPKSKGGSDDVKNLVVSCAKCNKEKGNLYPAEFIHKCLNLFCCE